MNKYQFKKLIIETLTEYDLPYSDNVIELLMLTASQETHLGKYIEQLNNGIALGVFQCEPNTYMDNLTYIHRKATYSDKWLRILEDLPKDLNGFNRTMFKGNLIMQILMCRVHYYRVKEHIPTDIEDIARYYKQYYNTYKGAATEKEALTNYKEYGCCS